MTNETLLPNNIPANDVKRILIVRLSAIGDCVHCLPSFAALRSAFPDAEIDWLIDDRAADLFRGLPGLTRLHVLPVRKWKSEGIRGLSLLLAMRRFGKDLRRFNYDVAIDFQGLTKSAWLAKLSGAPRRIGYDDQDGREISRWLNNERVAPPDAAVHVIDRNNALLTALGIQRVPSQFPLPDFSDEDDSAPVKTLFSVNGIESSVRPLMLYAGETWESKTSSIDWLAALADSLSSTFDRPVIIGWGGATDLKRTEAIQKRMTSSAILAPQTNLRQYAALVSRCGLFVGPDTGPMHIAAALNVPTVGIFGSTDELRNGPYGDRHTTVTADVVCRPCWKRRCPLKTGRLVCLERIQIDAVLAACRRIL